MVACSTLDHRQPLTEVVFKSIFVGNPFLVNILPSTDKPLVTGSALNFSPVDQLARLTIHNVDSENDIMAKVQGIISTV